MNATVSEAMTANPIAVAPDTPLQEAVKVLAEKRIGGLPVIDSRGHLVGMLSEEDLMQRESGVTTRPFAMFLDLVIYLENPRAHDRELHKVLGQTVGDVMGDRPPTITANSPLSQAARQLSDKQANSLAVVDPDGQLIGIITRGDIVRVMATVDTLSNES